MPLFRESAAMSSTRPDLAPAASDRPLKMLVVEDHPAMRAAVMALLDMAFPGCNVLSAHSAEHALPICDTEQPQVVIMDIALPGMNGIEAVRHITTRHPGIQVVMHSNSDMPAYREESMAAGARAFVSKGRTSHDLVPVITSLFA